jgi:hypothetical protein
MNMLIVLVVGIVAVILAWFLVKSFMKFIIIGVIVYTLFHVGFIWKPDELNSKLHLSSFLTADAGKKFQDAFTIFSNKRDEYAVVNTVEIKRVIDTSIQNALTQAKNEANSVDKQALLNNLKSQLEQFDTASVNQAIKDAQAELQKVNISVIEAQFTLKLTPTLTPAPTPTPTLTPAPTLTPVQ